MNKRFTPVHVNHNQFFNSRIITPDNAQTLTHVFFFLFNSIILPKKTKTINQTSKVLHGTQQRW